MKVLGWVTLAIIAVAMTWTIRGDMREDAAITAARDTVRMTDTVFLAQKDTASKAVAKAAVSKRRSDANDSAVHILDSVTVVVHDTVAAVPALIVADLRGLRQTVSDQDTAITRLTGALGAAVVTIAARDKLIALYKPESPWGLNVGGGYGCLVRSDPACGPVATLTVSYRVDLGRVLRKILPFGH